MLGDSRAFWWPEQRQGGDRPLGSDGRAGQGPRCRALWARVITSLPPRKTGSCWRVLLRGVTRPGCWVADGLSGTRVKPRRPVRRQLKPPKQEIV